MSNQSRTLWVSLAAALLAVFLLYSWSQDQRSTLSKKFGTSKTVVVAVKDIPEMTPIDDTMIEAKAIPQDYIQPSAVDSPELAIGQLAASPIKKGEQIMDTKLLLPGKLTGLAMEIQPGRRAFPVPVDDVRGVSRLIKPGDRIDVIASLDVGGGMGAKKEVRTVLQNVVVLATGTYINNQLPIQVEENRAGGYAIENLRLNTSFSTVTLEVTPDEAQKLSYIVSTNPAGLFLSLRNTNDPISNQLTSVTIDDVLGRPKMRQPSAFDSLPTSSPFPSPAGRPGRDSQPFGSPNAPNQPRRGY